MRQCIRKRNQYTRLAENRAVYPPRRVDASSLIFPVLDNHLIAVTPDHHLLPLSPVEVLDDAFRQSKHIAGAVLPGALQLSDVFLSYFLSSHGFPVVRLYN